MIFPDAKESFPNQNQQRQAGSLVQYKIGFIQNTIFHNPHLITLPYKSAKFLWHL